MSMPENLYTQQLEPFLKKYERQIDLYAGQFLTLAASMLARIQAQAAEASINAPPKSESRPPASADATVPDSMGSPKSPTKRPKKVD